jgi:predicted N-acyltransferase
VGTVPATPAQGYRFLCAAEDDAGLLSAMILAEAEKFCLKNRIPGIHLLFTDPGWAAVLPGLGYTGWEHSHFLWENREYADFEDYLSRFNKNRRKSIRREYRRRQEQNIALGIVKGGDAEEELFSRMFELFTITNDKFIPWDARWVNKDFFLLLEKKFRARSAFVEARRKTPGEARAGDAGELIALAFLVHKGDRIWGRYWGAYEEVKDLHFAACYYAPMEWALREGLRFFDPGAGSPHKILRGFQAVRDYSYHKFFDPPLERLFKGNIAAVNRFEAENRSGLNRALPFKSQGMCGEHCPSCGPSQAKNEISAVFTQTPFVD